MSTLVPPREFGRYRIVKKLGEGGMGIVLLAEDTLLNRKVALKIPYFEDGEVDKRAVQRFYREARVAAQIHHPNLCSVFDVGEHEGFHYLSMPYIEGAPLSRRIDRDNPWPVQDAVRLVCKLADALSVLHQKGIIHRDLKPGNILMDPEEEPIITDFGLAYAMENHSQRVTQLGMAIGTPAYMAPEQVIGKRDLDPRIDVYALGIILFELLTGTTPFVGPPAAIFGQILHVAAPPPSSLRPDLDPWLDAICLKALAKNPEDRYSSMQEMKQALLDESATTPYQKPSAPTTNESVYTYIDSNKTTDGPTRAQTVHEGPVPKQPPTTTRRGFPTRAVLLQCVVVGLLVYFAFINGVLNPGSGTTEKQSDPGKNDGKKPHVLEKEITNSIGMKLRLIPAGTFIMGSPDNEKGHADDEHQHKVEITRPFYLGIYEVTQGEYQKVMRKSPSHFTKASTGMDTSNFPVEKVSLQDAMAFCEKLSASPLESEAGRMYRLPTEAEWEYACRGGTKLQAYAFGDSLSSKQANIDGGTKGGPNLKRTCKVGSYEPNGFGLYDMHGNVLEWCLDRYDKDYYKTGPTKDPRSTNPASKTIIVRGGSWSYDYGNDARSAKRSHTTPSPGGFDIGFRVVCVLADE